MGEREAAALFCTVLLANVASPAVAASIGPFLDRWTWRDLDCVRYSAFLADTRVPSAAKMQQDRQAHLEAMKQQILDQARTQKQGEVKTHSHGGTP